jgi:hypothetical protein
MQLSILFHGQIACLIAITLLLLLIIFLHLLSTISQPTPLDQRFMGLSKPFNCTNNFFIVMYHVTGWPWLSKWKNQSELNNLFFLLNLIYTMNNLLQHYFRSLSKMELLIGNMNVVLQEIIFFPYLVYSNMVTKALWQLACFHNKLSLGAKHLLPPSI